MIPTFAGIVTITFFLTRMRPDTISQAAFGADGLKDTTASEAYQAELRKFFGYDKPLLTQYGIMWQNLIRLDFGTSRVDFRKVSEKIGEALPYTLALNLLTLLFVYLIAVPLGVWMALRDGTRTEMIVTVISYTLYSLPGFWVALLLLRYLAGGDFLDMFALGGFTSDNHQEMSWPVQIVDYIYHLTLPVLVSVYASVAFMSRYVKGSVLESLKSDYVRTARAKGVRENAVIYLHVLRNSLIPLITLLAGILPALFGGSVISETIFSIPGMGKLAYDAIYANDDTVIMAIVTVSAFLTLLGILIADIAYTLVDPRISFGSGESK